MSSNMLIFKVSIREIPTGRETELKPHHELIKTSSINIKKLDHSKEFLTKSEYIGKDLEEKKW